MYWDIRLVDSESDQLNLPKFFYTFAIALLLFSALINTVICLSTFLIAEIRLSNCGVLQILYCLVGFFTVFGMQMRMLTMLVFDRMILTYAYRYMACNIVPVLVILMGSMCTWISALLAIEFLLIECFNLNLHRSRKFSVISSAVVFLFVVGSHLHEIIGRRPLIDPYHLDTYTCTFIYSFSLDMIDKILRVLHIIIPCAIHFISSLAILISISRRTVFTRGLDNHWSAFARTCLKRKHFFVPPLWIIICNLPHLWLHLIDACENPNDLVVLRRHVAFNILVYVPPACTFFIYIFPSPSYMHKFRSTWIGRLCRKCSVKKISLWHSDVKSSFVDTTRLVRTSEWLCSHPFFSSLKCDQSVQGTRIWQME